MFVVPGNEDERHADVSQHVEAVVQTVAHGCEVTRANNDISLVASG